MKAKSKEHLATCHSYGVATVKELNNKFQERLCNYGYSTIVLHVGTNDLVKMMPSPSQKIPIVLSKMLSLREKCPREKLMQRTN